MNIVLSFILSSIGSSTSITCKAPYSEVVFKRSKTLLEQKNMYYNNTARVEEYISLTQGSSWVTVEKYGKAITLELNCTK